MGGLDYYRRFVAQVCKQVLKFSKENLAGFVIAVLILVYQVHYGLIIRSLEHSNEMAIFWPYIDTLLLYLGIQILRAPVVLDRDLHGLIGEKDREIGQLQGKLETSLRQIVIERLTFNPRTSTLFMEIVFHAGERRVTLHNLKFQSGDGSITRPLGVSLPPAFARPIEPEIKVEMADTIRVGIIIRCDGLTEEAIRDPTRGWQLTFSIADKQHSYRLPVERINA